VPAVCSQLLPLALLLLAAARQPKRHRADTERAELLLLDAQGASALLLALLLPLLLLPLLLLLLMPLLLLTLLLLLQGMPKGAKPLPSTCTEHCSACCLTAALRSLSGATAVKSSAGAGSAGSADSAGAGAAPGS
jgi:hypothetical protein